MSRGRTRRVGLDLGGLVGRVGIFRLSEGAKHDRAVERWFEAGPAELRAIARTWFSQMRRCGEDVGELIHDGCPVACVQDAPFGYVNAFKRHVNVGFFYGAMLEDPARLLEGAGKRMRHVKLQPGVEPNGEGLRALIDAAYSDIKARLAAERP